MLAIVELGKERIVIRIQDTLGIEAFGQNTGQGTFADANGTFDCYVSGQLKKIGHGLKGIAMIEHIPVAFPAQLREELTWSRPRRRRDCRLLRYNL